MVVAQPLIGTATCNISSQHTDAVSSLFFLSKNLVGMKIVRTFALQYRDVLPAKVHLAVLNWERECESPTVPQL